MRNPDPVARDEKLVRQGSGISYHEFELALGPDCHEHVVLDGYEPIILSECPDNVDDLILSIAFKTHDIRAHRAFTRSNLYFAMME